MLRKRILAVATATILALGMSVGGAAAAYADDEDDLVPVVIEPTSNKVWVCKYVGTPGVNETLKPGADGLINVAVSSIQQNQWDGVTVPAWFSDAQDRSYVLKYSEFQGNPPVSRPDVSECPTPDGPTEVSPSADSTPENCLDGEGTITFGSDAGVTYTVAEVPGAFGPGDTITGLSAGVYNVTATADTGYVLSGAAEFTVTVTETEIDCVLDSVEINPQVAVTPFDCLFGGAYELPDIDGVIWTVDGEVVEPGEYGVPVAGTEVSIVASLDPERDDLVFADGAVTEWDLLFAEPEGGCLETFPLVEPSVSFVMPTCEVPSGSYSLSDTEGVTWYVNDVESAAGTFSSAAGTTVTIEVVAEPGYGFGDEQETEWTATFTAPTDCELETLALTGPYDELINGAAYLAFLIILAGAGMMVRGRGVVA